MKRIVLIVSMVLVVSLLVGFGCAQPAPAPAPTPAPAPAPAPKPAPAPAPKPAPKLAPKLDPRAAIIEGAKKEGTVVAFLSSAFNPSEVTAALEKEIKKKYGVDLDIQTAGARGMGTQMGNAIMEHQTGAVPSFDLMGLSTTYIPQGIKAGIFEIVDWKPIIEKGTLPVVIPQNPDIRGGIVYLSTGNGVMYNPETISAGEVPRTLSDMVDPKWKGRLGIYSYTSHWTRWAFMLGKDNVLSYMRSLVKMKPIIQSFSRLNNRYLIGEFDLAFTNMGYVVQNQAKGMPTAWRFLDFIDVRDTHLMVRKGAKHPNAAKLVALYLASPEGVKFTVDVAKKGFIHYPGNYMYDLVEQGKRDGLTVYTVDSFPGLLDFIMSPDWDKWQKEVKLIIQGG